MKMLLKLWGSMKYLAVAVMFIFHFRYLSMWVSSVSDAWGKRLHGGAKSSSGSNLAGKLLLQNEWTLMMKTIRANYLQVQPEPHIGFIQTDQERGYKTGFWASCSIVIVVTTEISRQGRGLLQWERLDYWTLSTWDYGMGGNVCCASWGQRSH